MKALISGISGQDASYLAELLLDKGYDVYGTTRRVSVDQDHRFENIRHIRKYITILSATVDNYPSIFNVINDVKPDELYHLAAQSFVTDSFSDEFTTMRSNVNGTHNILSILKNHLPDCRMYFAGSSEMFGDVLEEPQSESTPFNPRSAYGISKCAGFYLTKHYRTAYGIHASNGILFNHESPRRGVEFVTRKVCRAAARIKCGLETKLQMGNLSARRDWGHARDYVRAMHLMLQRPEGDDFVISTGQNHSVHDLCREAFKNVGLDCDEFIECRQELMRPSEVHTLTGDAGKAKALLGWNPSVTFSQLIAEMVESELIAISNKSSQPSLS